MATCSSSSFALKLLGPRAVSSASAARTSAPNTRLSRASSGGSTLVGVDSSSSSRVSCGAQSVRHYSTIASRGVAGEGGQTFAGRQKQAGRAPVLSLQATSSSSSSSSRAGRGAMAAAAASSSSVAVAASESEGVRGEVNMEGKICIVTGANTGMGIVIAEELALKGAKVIMACRSEERGKAAEEKVWRAIKAKGAKGEVEYHQLDLSDLQSVRSFVDWFVSKYSVADRLINNAGIMMPPHSFTKDGFESQFQVNHLSHYLLTRLLLPSLEKSQDPSIIHISSLAGERVSLSKGEFWDVAKVTPEKYNPFTAYRNSKLAQVLFTVEMNRRLGDKVTVNAVHPGIVNTELFNRSFSPFLKAALAPLGWLLETTGAVYSSAKGASTAVYLATHSKEVTSTGGYYADCAPRPANPCAFNEDLGKEWWDESAKASGLDP